MFKTIKDYDVKGKGVFLRVDLNVPIKDGKIKDDSRIVAAIPTIKYLLERGCKVVAVSHLGRPKGGVSPEFSLLPVANRLAELIKDYKILFANDVVGEDAKRKFSQLKEGELLLLENIRFEQGETKGDEELAWKLRNYGDIYVTDAFGALHRAHTSVYQTAKLFDVVLAGFLVEKEIIYLKEKLSNPERPYIAVLGGAKVSDKIPILESLVEKVDGIVIGGAMAYTFFLAKNIKVGKSLVEEECKEVAYKVMKRAEERKIPLLLPVDNVVSRSIDEKDIKVVKEIKEEYAGFDIGEETIKTFSELIRKGKTIVWNGPMGVFEKEQFKKGSVEIAKVIASCDALKIVGGGDSVSAIKVANVEDKISHISTGGGASLELIAGKKLPGVEILYEKAN